MADMLAQVGDLSDLVDETIAADLETLLLELATAAVQTAAGQRILRVADDVVDLLGIAEPALVLPERPVVSVSSVLIDGTAVTDFVLRGSRLWRDQGWAGAELLGLSTLCVPTVVTVTYTHGYEQTDQNIQLARHATLTLAARQHANPVGVTGMSIDDYREQYSQAVEPSAGDVPESLRRALRRKYGLGVGMVTAT